MNKRLAFGVGGLAVVAAAVAIVVVLGRAHQSSSPHASAPDARDVPPTASGLDPLVEEFRATERTCLQRYNNALREQRENKIDELELSNTIERDVLQPWRALRAKVIAAPRQDALYATLRRYLEARQVSWEAYVAGLRAPTDEAARSHYEAHRLHNAEAQEHAKELGRMFRAAAAKAQPTP